MVVKENTFTNIINKGVKPCHMKQQYTPSLLLIGIIVLLLSFSSCSEQKDEASGQDDEAIQETGPVKKTPPDFSNQNKEEQPTKQQPPERVAPLTGENQEQEMPGADDDPDNLPSDLVFIVDEGYRLDYAAQVHVVIDEDTGIFYATHKDTSQDESTQGEPTVTLLYTSEDGLTFSDPVEFTDSLSLGEGVELPALDRAVLMPELDDDENEFWRKFWPAGEDGWISSKTYDGNSYTEEDGIRYEFQEGESSQKSIGYRSFFVNTNGELILLYISGFGSGGDAHMRLAVSEDNGWTFEFVDDNPLNDKGTEETGMNQRDPRFTVLPNGTARLFTMVQGGSAPTPGRDARGYIYSFYTENGYIYELEPGIRLQPSDFTEFEVWSLNDPEVIQLPDGRYRMYVTARIKNDNPDAEQAYKEVIVSATTAS